MGLCFAVLHELHNFQGYRWVPLKVCSSASSREMGSCTASRLKGVLFAHGTDLIKLLTEDQKLHARLVSPTLKGRALQVTVEA